MTDTIKVDACPKCESSNTHSRMTMEPRYVCGDCGEEFDEPLEREPDRHWRDDG